MSRSLLRMDVSPLRGSGKASFRVLYALAAAMSLLTALQRPSLDAAIPRTVPRHQLAAAAALLSISGDAGAADMVSGIFRGTLWNQTIPDQLRGRLAGVEMLSYSVGPSAGQLRAGGVASVTTPRIAAWSGGLLCMAAVGAICLALPTFWRFSGRAPGVSPAPEALAR